MPRKVYETDAVTIAMMHNGVAVCYSTVTPQKFEEATGKKALKGVVYDAEEEGFVKTFHFPQRAKKMTD